MFSRPTLDLFGRMLDHCVGGEKIAPPVTHLLHVLKPLLAKGVLLSTKSD